MSLLPDLARQLRLPYNPHGGESYSQTYVTPGTVDPEIPDHGIANPDTPAVERADKRLSDTAGFSHLMDQIFEATHRPGFEYAGPYTLGGKSQTALGQIANVTGVGSIYSISNPWDNDAEFCCLSASFGGAGQAVLSIDSNNQGPALTQFYDGTSYIRALPFFAAAAGTFTYGNEYWFPCPASQPLYWAVNMATPNTNSALATVSFRRRINRYGRFYLTIE